MQLEKEIFWSRRYGAATPCAAKGTRPEGRFEARYYYDALGRRTRKTVTSAHGPRDTRFLWQGYRLLQEQHESGHNSSYIYDPNGAWSPLAQVDQLQGDKQGEIYWFSTDLNGAPLEVTDASGALRWSGGYGSFGEVRYQTDGFTRRTQSTALPHQPQRYADSETGLQPVTLLRPADWTIYCPGPDRVEWRVEFIPVCP